MIRSKLTLTLTNSHTQFPHFSEQHRESVKSYLIQPQRVIASRRRANQSLYSYDAIIPRPRESLENLLGACFFFTVSQSRTTTWRTEISRTPLLLPLLPSPTVLLSAPPPQLLRTHNVCLIHIPIPGTASSASGERPELRAECTGVGRLWCVIMISGTKYGAVPPSELKM